MKFSQPVIVLAAIFLFTVLVLTAFSGSGFSLGGCVASVRVDDFIDYGSPHGVQETIELLREADADQQVKAILLEVNSGGGSAAATKELFDALAGLEKPCVAYVEDAAASGGYYAASACREIVANPNALLGSIGARMTILNYEELFEKIGLSEESIQTGEMKDVGSPTRNMTPGERELLQQIIDESFQNFKTDLEEARKGKLTPAYYEVLDGRVLSPKMALNAGLIDAIETRDYAEDLAGELGGLGPAPEIRAFEPESTWADYLSVFASSITKTVLSPGGQKLRYS
ncbi:signal peptide peptidase SppA [Candidatus Micrarchaeota archaeon CG_4_10_14_0_2_um_filter_55_9]|nr:MAG: signal peptide peptidase SppA [Candidatus Micrarchaeota archaeon CG_4_10_14_0_2_um_filter_55_9]